jgi:ACS family hexuronate transporter-like MFS transporter
MKNDRTRWVLLAVLSSITIVNYVDRQTLSILYVAMNRELHLPDTTYAQAVTLFLIAYTVMYTVGGWLVDRLGARWSLALALAWWSVATALTSLVHTPYGLYGCRIMMALAQPIVFSAGVKACAEFFPTQQRALATGIFSAGSGVGALIATPLLATATLHWGWRITITLTAAAGLVLVPLWLVTYAKTTRQAAPPSATTAAVSWYAMLRQRRVWAIVLPRAIGDPLWYFCLFWMPQYLEQSRHLTLQQVALFGWLPFLFADAGSILGGSLSDTLIRRGVAPVRSRLIILLCAALMAPAGILIGFAPTVAVAIALMGVIAFASQCWATTTTALATDLFPRSSVGAIVGMMGTAGGIGGAVFAQVTGATVRNFGFTPAFAMAALLVPAGFLLLIGLLRGQKTQAPQHTPEPVAV